MTTGAGVWAIVLAGGMGARSAAIGPSSSKESAGDEWSTERWRRRCVPATASRWYSHLAMNGMASRYTLLPPGATTNRSRFGPGSRPCDRRLDRGHRRPGASAGSDALFEAVIDKVRRGADGAVPVIADPRGDPACGRKGGRNAAQAGPGDHASPQHSEYRCCVRCTRADLVPRRTPACCSSGVTAWTPCPVTRPTCMSPPGELDIARNLVAGRSLRHTTQQSPLNVGRKDPVRRAAPQSAEGQFS